MDISYLLFLQNLRESAPVFISTLLKFFSEFTVSSVYMMVPAIIFWCIEKDAGNFLFFTGNCTNVIGSVIKDTACIYRPWIKDTRVKCTLMKSATGYSFPSGHSMTAVSFYGGLGIYLRKFKTWLLYIMLIPILLTGFARNWFGAHTPQDVIVGILIAVLMMFLMIILFGYLEKNPDKDVLIVSIGIIACILVLLYVSFKSYPMDYAADGTLLVDPKEMMNDCFKDVGRFMGVLVGFIMERRLVKFSVEGKVSMRILRGVIGAATALVVYIGTQTPLKALLGINIGSCAYSFLTMFYICGIYPLFIKLVQGKAKKDI